MSTTYYFVIVGTNDAPMYEAEIGQYFSDPSNSSKRDEYRHLNQFIVHSALDLVDDAILCSNS
ncbi:Trafficking protein particle complex subunit 2, partial [Smittium culicis]